MDGQERIAALQHLGASFHEGRRRISKVATPADDLDDKIPTFLDNQCVDGDNEVITTSRMRTLRILISYFQTTGLKYHHSPHNASRKTLPERIQ